MAGVQNRWQDELSMSNYTEYTLSDIANIDMTLKDFACLGVPVLCRAPTLQGSQTEPLWLSSVSFLCRRVAPQPLTSLLPSTAKAGDGRGRRSSR